MASPGSFEESSRTTPSSEPFRREGIHQGAISDEITNAVEGALSSVSNFSDALTGAVMNSVRTRPYPTLIGAFFAGFALAGGFAPRAQRAILQIAGRIVTNGLLSGMGVESQSPPHVSTH